MTALANGTGDEEMRAAFTSQLVRSGNREYLLAKWGRPKPKPEQPDLRWSTPFNRRLPLAWWSLDGARRACILGGPPLRGALTHEDMRSQRAVCPFDEALAAAAEQQPRGNGGGSTFLQRLAARQQQPPMNPGTDAQERRAP